MTHPSNETQIQELVENWVAAVKARDIDAILLHHSDEIIMFDVPEPFQSTGIGAYKKTWDTFFAATKTGVFDIQTLKIVAGEDVAFCFATMKCIDRNASGVYEELDFRLTIGLKKIAGQWTILHEHHSIPAKD